MIAIIQLKIFGKFSVNIRRLLLLKMMGKRSNALAMVDLPRDKKLIFVDVSVIHARDVGTGIQRVVRAFLHELAKNAPVGHSVRPVFATKSESYKYAEDGFFDFFPDRNGPLGHSDIDASNGDIFLCLDLAPNILPRHETQMLDWKMAGVKFHVLVYDLFPLMQPQWFNPATVRRFKKWLDFVAVYADAIICTSVAMKVDIKNWLLGIPGFEVQKMPLSVISLGSDIGATLPTKGMTQRSNEINSILKGRDFVLMVGTIEPRKGYIQALEAFDILWRRDRNFRKCLVIVGREGWRANSIISKLKSLSGESTNVIWIADATDELLDILYRDAAGFLMASYAEGFGLPLVEAGLHGKAILSRDLPVVRELGLTNIEYFSGLTSESLANAIALWLKIARSDPEPHNLRSWRSSYVELINALGLSVSLH